MERLTRHILLIGLRGSGKSTLGRLLAERVGAPLIDVDDEALRALGAPDIATAWRQQGEAAFRDAEREALERALAADPPAIIAAGGGTPMAPGAQRLIRDAQAHDQLAVVYLRCSPATLRARLQSAGGADANRPSLTGADPLAEIEDVFAQRDPVYSALADVAHEGDAIAATAAGAQTAADDVLALLNM